MKSKPFIEAVFYLSRALEPYAELQVSDLDTLLNANLSMMVLPDVGALTPTQLERLDGWVRNGGLLLRFAGSAMEQARQHFLIPTPLRPGSRSLDGALAWETPPRLQSFSEASPLAGLRITEDVTVKQQLLAQPDNDLSDKIWASLDDGTPLITASAFDQGLLIMVHTTASPDWSNLPLTGVFVHMLNRFVKLAGHAPDRFENASGSIEALRVLNGYGRLEKPHADVKPLAAEAVSDIVISREHPPGIYGRAGFQRPVNFGDYISGLSSLTDLAPDVRVSRYGAKHETDLAPFLLLGAALLLLLDWCVMLMLASGFRYRVLRRGTAALLIALSFSSLAHAQVPDNLQYADGLYLAFIKSDDAALNAQTRRGLEALKEALAQKTSAEPSGVVGLDPETDMLSFFPLIYWPVDAGDTNLSERALGNVQDYLDHGGDHSF